MAESFAPMCPMLFINLARLTAFRSGPDQVMKRAGRKHAYSSSRRVPTGYSSNGIAVGMTIADHPPHRSVLAELPHTAPPLDTSVEALIGIRMKSTRARNPSIKDRPDRKSVV